MSKRAFAVGVIVATVAALAIVGAQMQSASGASSPPANFTPGRVSVKDAFGITAFFFNPTSSSTKVNWTFGNNIGFTNPDVFGIIVGPHTALGFTRGCNNTGGCSATMIFTTPNPKLITTLEYVNQAGTTVTLPAGDLKRF